MSDTSSSDTDSIPKEIGPFDHLTNPKIPFISIHDVSDDESERSSDNESERSEDDDIGGAEAAVNQDKQEEVNKSVEPVEPVKAPLVDIYYRCHKCTKTFTKQSDYLKHLGRIMPCVEAKDIKSIKARIAPDYQRQLDKLEYEIKELEALVGSKIAKKEKLKKYAKLLETYKLFAGYTRVYAMDKGNEYEFDNELKEYISKIHNLKTKLG